MSQPNQYQHPAWGQQPPAAWGAPPPQPPKRNTGKVIGLVCLAVVAVLVLFGAIGAAVSGGDGNEPAAEAGTEASPAGSPEPSGTELTAECRAWIEKELLDSTDDIDANAGQAVCGDMSDEEMDQAIDEVTDDLMAEGATPEEDSEGYGDGDYVVGDDIPAGTYETSGAKSGVFELCTITTEPTSDTKFPQLKTANADERIIITLTKDDGVVSISGCEPLTPR
ncbi:hypothetical protein H1V43_32290 [Streptomyces sp. PSKA54]|uniref:Uncharacterized protein n=1 Tax=Streptomyces himalayensis subsp. aureolus TaxID=2758039 RepID=A0A7W2D788_9ACTN|nr:hypothetical protein [Streptomyces himalayensis]MBA4865944.1 hypothetical protein [Streptomyces himalayensis subsp. aureolus]